MLNVKVKYYKTIIIKEKVQKTRRFDPNTTNCKVEWFSNFFFCLVGQKVLLSEQKRNKQMVVQLSINSIFWPICFEIGLK